MENISRYKDYAVDLMWVPTDLTGEIFGDNENCTNPKKLFENIVAKPSDLIRRINYHYTKVENGSSYEKVNPTLEHGIISLSDHHKYGRCFTSMPTPDMLKRKINRITLYIQLFKNIFAPIVVFHTPGTFTKTLIGQITQRLIF